MLKYKGSWPSLGYHGVIFVSICQTVMKCVLAELILILNTGKMSCCPNWRTSFSIMHFHSLLGKQRELKAVRESIKN